MSFFSSIPVWGWFDISFNFAVLVALCGEADWALKRLIPKKPDIVPSAEWRRKKLKKKFEWLLIFGIAGEVACLPFSLKESADANSMAGRANESAANAKSNNLVLSIELEKLKKDNQMQAATIVDLKARQIRFITLEQKEKFINLTKDLPKFTNTMIFAEGDDRETIGYARDIREVLEQSHYLPGPSFSNVRFNIPVENETIGLYSVGDTNRDLPMCFLCFGTPNVTDARMARLECACLVSKLIGKHRF